MLDVLIQTYNEEENLPHTLESLKGWVNHVFIVDSGSTDRTRELAEEWGATVIFHAWEGYARQKNWGLDNMEFEAPWTLIVDADEAVSPELRDEILQVVNQPPEQVRESGFRINRVFVFAGRKIWHCGYFPSWNLRLFKRGQARYEERLVHEHMLCDGPVGELKSLLIHHDRRGLEHFFAKHNRYSTLEAREMYTNPEPWPGVGEFLGNQTRRRRFLKSRILPKLPFVWLWRFVYMFILRGGILDGRAGWELSKLISTYELLIHAKYRELRRLRHGTSVARVGDTAAGLARPEGAASVLERRGELPVTPAANTGKVGLLQPGGPSPVPSIPGRVAGPNTPTVARSHDELGDADSRGSVVYEGAARREEPDERAKPFGGDRVGKTPVSIVIPTLNEASNLPRCLDHLTWADEVVVVDSGSKDETREIAEKYGAKVVDFEWNGRWPKKKNWALRHAPLTNEWVLIVDADEWITPELAREIDRVIREKQNYAGFYVNRRFIFMGRWIKHCGYYPSWNLRLIRRGHGEYERLTDVGNTGSGDNEVHEHVVPTGPVDYLDHDMLHFAFPNIHTFMEKHNRYSNWEAIVQRQKGEAESAAIGNVLSRRRRLKNFSRALPFRPLLRFLYSYVWKLGFLDGRPGYVFSRLLAIYEYLSVAKYIELKRAENDETNARSLSDVPPAM